MTDENNLLFDESTSTNFIYIISYLEKITEISASNEPRVRSLISYPRRRAHDFYHRHFSKNGKLIDEAKSYDTVKAVLCKPFLTKTDRQILKMHYHLNSARDSQLPNLLLLLKQTTSQPGLRRSKCLFFLSKAIVIGEKIQHFIVLRAPNKVSEATSFSESV